MGPICHVYKSMKFIKRLNREKFLWLIGGIKVMEKYKISAQYL